MIVGTVDASFTDNKLLAGEADKKAVDADAKAVDADKKAVDAAAKAEAAQTQANTALTSANGKNKNFYGSAEPTGQKTNDLWFKYNANGICVAIYRWNGTAWTNEVDQDKIQQSIDAAKKEAAAASSAADKKAAAAQAQADAALTKAQSGFDDAQTALGNAATADSTAKKAIDNAAAVKVIADANTKNVATVKATADGLQTAVFNKDGTSKITQTANELMSKIEATDGKVSEVTQTASSLGSRLTSAEGNISAVTQTANSLGSRLTSAEGKVSTVTQTADGLQTAVFNKDGSSKITQLADVIDSKISKVDADGKYATQSQLTQTSTSLQSTITQTINDLEIGGRNIVLNSTWNNGISGWTNPWGTTYSIVPPEDDKPNSSILKIVPASTTSQKASDAFRIEVGRKYTISFDVKIDTVKNNTGILFIVRSFNAKDTGTGAADSVWSQTFLKFNDITVANKWIAFTFTFTPTAGEWLRVIPYNADGAGGTPSYFREIMVVEGDKSTKGWTPAPEDMATQSQISQLVDNINLRVKENDVVNQINLSKEGILIDGKKVHITGQTTIDDASISSAKIVSLLASKIIADSLSVISANLGNVTAGNITGVNISGSTLKISNKPKYEDGTTFVQMKNGEIFVTDINPDTVSRANANDVHINNGAIWMTGNNAAGIGIYELDLAPKYILFSEFNANNTLKYQTNIRAEFLESPKVTTIDLTVNGKTALNGNVVINGQLIVPGIGSDVNMNNYNLKNVNHMTINDYGGNEGIEWLGGNNWKIFESPDDTSNNPGAFQFFTGSTRRATIGATGNIYATGTLFRIQGTGGSYEAEGKLSLLNKTGLSEFHLSSDATSPFIQSMDIYNRTYSFASNVYVTSNGVLGRSTSARKYKLDIEDSKVDPHRLLEINPRSWYDKSATEAYADALTAEQAGEIVDWDDVDIPGIERVHGLIAEEVIQAGLPEFASYGEFDKDGNREVEGLMYDRLWTLLIPIVREHKEEIALLNATMKQQQQTIENMAALMAKMEQRITALEN
ncbi:gp58-like family protein [Peribacillus sp. TH14]|uniref:gp58-like family protein n=1 Tax=Peribacillus sp. TH14 TaxID=2798481 RepID=UPI00191367C9|nr:gp58-like family protein [Peribacillus sp. TH14]MBK5497408.1 hypothetical protein [Peribacillus sp. TH14]